MTKEELIMLFSKSDQFSPSNSFVLRKINEFFESNICIPKGTNRHPYADVLHVALEGNGTLEARSQINPSHSWKYAWKYATLPSKDLEYRIKPTELVYEWLYYDDEYGEPRLSKSYLTKEEAFNFNWVKRIEETKRERK